MTTNADLPTDFMNTLGPLLELTFPLMLLPITMIILLNIVKMVFHENHHSSYDESEKPEKKMPVKPSKAIKEMIKGVDGDVEPEWLEKLVRYEKQPIEDKKVKTVVEQMEKALETEYERFKGNFKEFKGLVLRADGNLADIAENPDDNPVLLSLAVGLSKQKELVLKIGEEILEMRIQEDTATRAKKANELAEKMGKELDETKGTATVRKTARSVHEEVLHEILSSKEATAEMKERAEAMLPHFKSVSPEEEQVEMKRQDFELDLQTLEKIMTGNLELEEKATA